MRDEPTTKLPAQYLYVLERILAISKKISDALPSDAAPDSSAAGACTETSKEV